MYMGNAVEPRCEIHQLQMCYDRIQQVMEDVAHYMTLYPKSTAFGNGAGKQMLETATKMLGYLGTTFLFYMLIFVRKSLKSIDLFF